MLSSIGCCVEASSIATSPSPLAGKTADNYTGRVQACARAVLPRFVLCLRAGKKLRDVLIAGCPFIDERCRDGLIGGPPRPQQADDLMRSTPCRHRLRETLPTSTEGRIVRLLRLLQRQHGRWHTIRQKAQVNHNALTREGNS